MNLQPQHSVSPLPRRVGERIKVRGKARALRRQPTWAERTLWRYLRNRQFAHFKFRRQHPFGPYFLDFYCVTAKLAIELDGDPHGQPQQGRHDRVRDVYLQKHGIHVLRFWNTELVENREGVLTTILAALERQTTTNPHPDPLPYTTRERERIAQENLSHV